MSKKIFTILAMALVAIFALSSLNFAFADDEPYINQTFDDVFTIEVPLEKTLSPASVNGSLGSVHEYYDSSTEGNFRNGGIIVYYYDDSILSDNESDVMGHVLQDLTTTYSYQLNQNDDEMAILENDADMCGIPPFLAGKSNGEGKVVLVGGENLNELESYVNSIQFLN